MAAYFIHISRRLESLLRGDEETTWIGELKTLALWRACAAEFLGTMLFVFIGCSAIIAPTPTDHAAKTVQIALAFGLAIMAMVMMTGHISGGHINPAVSIAFAVSLAISPIRAALYVVSQLLGAVVGAAILYGVSGAKHRGNLGANGIPDHLTAAQGFGYEVVITFVLVAVIMATTDGKRTTFAGVGLEIGLTVTVCHLAGIHYSGASMNPARSFGPAIIMDIWKNHWIYWVGPIVGGCLASVMYKYVLSPYRGVETVEKAITFLESEKSPNMTKVEEHEMAGQTQLA